MPQITIDRPSVPSALCQHIVTLRHPQTEDERCLVIETATNAFGEVLREIANQRTLHKLIGYEIRESLEVSAPF